MLKVTLFLTTSKEEKFASSWKVAGEENVGKHAGPTGKILNDLLKSNTPRELAMKT